MTPATQWAAAFFLFLMCYSLFKIFTSFSNPKYEAVDAIIKSMREDHGCWNMVSYGFEHDNGLTVNTRGIPGVDLEVSNPDRIKISVRDGIKIWKACKKLRKKIELREVNKTL